MTGQEPRIFYFQWHITDRCNLNCMHCYQTQGCEYELDTAGIELVLARITKAMKKWKMRAEIGITGGEPLLHRLLPYLLERLDYMETVDSYCIMTNGTLVDKGLARWLKTRRRLKFVQVSIDGTSSRVHDSLRGPGAFCAALEGVHALVEQGVATRLMFTFSSLNMADAPYFPRFAFELGVGGFSVERVVPCRSASSFVSQMLSPGHVREVFTEIDRAYRALHTEPSKLYFARTRPLWVLLASCNNELGGCCSAGLNSLCILPNLDLLACRRLPIKVGNLAEDTIFKVWYLNDVLQKLRDRKNLKGRCFDCRYVRNCAGCRAIAYAVCGDYLEEDPQCWKTGTSI